MELARWVVLITATVTMGLFAGVFYTFSSLVMIGLRRVDDRTFVSAMQKINAAPGLRFAVAIIGPGVFTCAALALNLWDGDRSALPWIVTALLLYLVAIGGITFLGNVPRNRALAAAGDPDRIGDLAGVRREFEVGWARWNAARAVVSIGALVSLIIALVSTATEVA